VVDEELRAPSEEVCQRGAPFIGLEPVLLIDPDPRQLLTSTRQLVALRRVSSFSASSSSSRAATAATRCIPV
jgi:hypothetical protein